MARAKSATEAAEPVTMQHESDGSSYTLTIGETEYEVTGGVVTVAAEHFEAAHQAGFRSVA
jgi:hypothetical protein